MSNIITSPIHLPAAIAALFFSLPTLSPASADQQAPWRDAEAPALQNHIQITHPDTFLKAGEAYFSPDTGWIIFQAIPRPTLESTPGTPSDAEPDKFYSMYVAKLIRNHAGDITGIEEPTRVSAPGSANTCGFFHPLAPWRIIFGSTLTPPADVSKAGYQRGASRYAWQFQEEMEVCTRTLLPILHDKMENTPSDATYGFDPADISEARPIWTRPGYDAECAYSPDGRYIVHSQVNIETGDSDLHLYDTQTKLLSPLIAEPGYDGGPFFSPDGKRICYRSDRAGNDLLQLFVADLSFNDAGAITGVTRERPITQNQHVNWAPFWHPTGAFLIYATSEVGHHNYEVFAIEVPSADAPDTPADALKKRRLTSASGFDGLPVFNADGSLMMWTSQRGPTYKNEERPSSQIWIAHVVNASPQ